MDVLADSAARASDMAVTYRQLYIDLDGVLADLDAQFEIVMKRPIDFTRGLNDHEWSALRAKGDFFFNMQPMPEAYRLWAFARSIHTNPIILTGIPAEHEYSGAREEKIAWVKVNVEFHARVICCRAKDKRLYCRPGDVLVDDRTVSRDLWEEAGGIFIRHDRRNPDASIAALGAIFCGQPPFVLGDLTLDFNSNGATWKGVDVRLTPSEFRLIRAMTARAGQNMTYRAMYDCLTGVIGFAAGTGAKGFQTNVRSSVKRIRASFLRADPAFAQIENMTAYGYRWAA